MAYFVRKKDPNEDIRSQWEKQEPNYKTEKTMEEIRSLGGSQRFGEGGKWVNNSVYQSIGGYRSRGGIPLKLKTKNGNIPISETDAYELLQSGDITFS
jgi:hypothetical protein